MLRNLAMYALGFSVIVALASVLAHAQAHVINTAGIARVRHLWYWIDFPYLIFQGMGYLSIAWGIPTMIKGYKHMRYGAQDATKAVLFGAAAVACGLAIINFSYWFFYASSQADLFC